ncbi:DEAD/DEAH box helicase [Rhodopirellula europaea]|uniref:DEAD/DEAH box helicase n=1 Tax=Rhodopirellula europaea TaxID=1263866 RepID=UPI003D29CCC6|tara:strand:- start:8761 stop:11937 length:3177 start_codon:yes stop_codon:yes gene_type:complete
MSHWILDGHADLRLEASQIASRIQLQAELLREVAKPDGDALKRVLMMLEIAIQDILLDSSEESEESTRLLKELAAEAFTVARVIDRPSTPIEEGLFVLRACCFGVLADKGADASRWLKLKGIPNFPQKSDDWGQHTWANILDVWLRIFRKDGWEDRDQVLTRIAELRDSQKEFEEAYLSGQESANVRTKAIELMGLYHLAKAAEIFALFMTDGVVDGNFQVKQLLDSHFDRVQSVCRHFRFEQLEPLCRLLSRSAAQMVENSIWTVTRSVNSRVTRFVESLVERGRGNRAIFDVLPPQRRALAERGLLGSSRRAVVVSLPTSSGKTLIAEFRILQALNQFESEQGWVAYLAPTRTLVSQIARQLRRDFSPLGVSVEQVSPALEIDNVEAEMLNEATQDARFRVLVTTPEKLDLMLRQDWEQKIGRPLTLVVVDEAHNLQDTHRGLKLELLLATINKECQRAQFLLLTPFIDNAKEVARWLGGQNSDDISLSLDWQPNDRVIGIVQAEVGEAINKRSYDYNVRLKTFHTTRKTLAIDELVPLAGTPSIANTFRKVSGQSALAAVTAQDLHRRGPVIVMHSRPDWVWSLANRLKIEENAKPESPKRKLVQDFLRLEFGDDFPLVDLINYGVGVHHGGLSDDVRGLMEWLFEEEELSFLVATTTIAQGVNFPVSAVVMASHQYPTNTGARWVDMSPEDFWNIAGRAGRVSQGQLGVVALVAKDEKKADELAEFIGRQAGALNSALVSLALAAGDELRDLGGIVYRHPEWSTFVQYLAHTYREMGRPETFAAEVEQVLRNTFGFDKLRSQYPELAEKLLGGVNEYTKYLSEPGRPIKLVDSTGFSLQSIVTVLTAVGKQKMTPDVWDGATLFSAGNTDLQSMMGILLKVPELRENLEAVTGGDTPDGDSLANILKDWVNGASVKNISERYFLEENGDMVDAMTKCGRNLFGRLTQTAAWGIGALLSITGGALPEERQAELRNLASRVFYGVDSDAAIVYRLLGVPRTAATKFAADVNRETSKPIASTRAELRGMSSEDWKNVVGSETGAIYRDVWRVLEGLD